MHVSYYSKYSIAQNIKHDSKYKVALCALFIVQNVCVHVYEKAMHILQEDALQVKILLLILS